VGAAGVASRRSVARQRRGTLSPFPFLFDHYLPLAVLAGAHPLTNQHRGDVNADRPFIAGCELRVQFLANLRGYR